jgi:16S rRNA G966 N2-methylase RsmD
MVEQNLAVYRDLRENARQLEASQVQIINADARQFLSNNQQAFDVVFLDPPFNKGWLEGLLEAIPGHLSPQARVYVEAERALNDLAGFNVLKHGKAGQVFYHLLECRHAT